MQPVGNDVYVEEVKKKKSEFDLVNGEQVTYRVTKLGKDVSLCKKGDFLLFSDVREYNYNGQRILVVNEDDIRGVESV